MSSASLEEYETGAPDVRAQIYHYRMAGDSIAEISDRLGLAPRTTVRLFREYIKFLAENQPDREESRLMDLHRLDMLQKAFWHTATEPHMAPITVGKGDSAHVEMVEVDADKDSAKVVLDIMKHRAKLLGMELLPPSGSQVVQQILVVGQSTQAFLDALAEGQRKPLTSGDKDNDVEGDSVIEGVVE